MLETADFEIEPRLVDLGRWVVLPRGEGVAEVVAARVRMQRVAPRRRFLPAWRLVAAGALVPVALGALVLGSSGTARHWVAERLDASDRGVASRVLLHDGLGPQRIPYVHEGDSGASLGVSVTVAEAEERVGFDVRFPRDPALGDPDRAFVEGPFGDGLALAWDASKELPSFDGRGMGMLLAEVPGALDDVVSFDGDETPSVDVTVNGRMGVWKQGVHEFITADGTRRWAASTLTWSIGGITLTMESWLDRERAVEIAETVR